MLSTYLVDLYIYIIYFRAQIKDKTVTKELSNKIKTLSTIEIYDATMLIPINNGESLTDFSEIINLK